MTIPSIRNYETRPPAGGWGVEYTFQGQKFPCTGNWKDVSQKIARIQQRNNAFISMDAIFDYLNPIWCGRDPKRCMTPAQTTAEIKRTGSGCSRCGQRRRR